MFGSDNTFGGRMSRAGNSALGKREMAAFEEKRKRKEKIRKGRAERAAKVRKAKKAAEIAAKTAARNG
jgi:hypothetical protein